MLSVKNEEYGKCSVCKLRSIENEDFFLGGEGGRGGRERHISIGHEKT